MMSDAHSVIGNTSLREVISANSLGSIPATDLFETGEFLESLFNGENLAPELNEWKHNIPDQIEALSAPNQFWISLFHTA